ncbi:integrin alpha-7 isoform X4 [Emydura macquarii macquarii]|uniref:integrin alpha-7 isoform X4 n=1 Tax=Emydura macquarii macquarii TaxID=1129001 RepID=UPI003529EE8E
MWGALGPWLCCLGLHLLGGAAFNLDGAETLLKDGAGGSLFGFSVALHRQLRPQPVSWMLVGAPQAPALPGQGANRTGGLYACPLTREIDDCWRVPIDEGADLHKESKENQWLGVSVKSQGAGGKIVTCAHLYESRHRVNQPLETRAVIGRCYLLSQDLGVADELDGGEWKFCQGRPQGHDRFGFCQQGLSASFTADTRYVLFGAPGTYNWKGDLRVELVNHSSLELLTYDDGPYEAGGEKDQDPSLIPVPAHSYFGLLFMTNIHSSDPDQLVYKTPEPGERLPGSVGDLAQNSYLGFSVDSGKGLTRRDQLSFVAGAPRANHTGAVVILRQDNVNRLVPEFILPGEQLTSSFGYAVAVADLNSDGWMDLVVGAPHFFDRQEDLGGAAYVYVNQAGRWASTRPVRLNGTSGSAFGTALGAIGDLNQDGFQDIAVGAPFDGAGKVFIYHGSSLGIVTKPAQVLDGEGVGVRTFGYSLSGGLDVDGNLYPDLLVGSLSDSVVLYRARPVIHVSKNITLTPQHIDLESRNCPHQLGICVDVQACFSYTANPASYSPRVTLAYTFDADVDRQKLGQAPRVTFLDRKPTDSEHQFSDVVELPHQLAHGCVKATFRLQDSIRDKLRPIAVELTYSIKHARSKRQVPGAALSSLMPVLNAQLPSSQRAEVHFLKQGCGDDKICQSNLQLRSQFCSRLGDADFLPLPRGADGTAVFAMSDQKDVALEIQVTNLPSDPAAPQRDGDDAHEALLTVTFPPALPYAGIRPHDTWAAPALEKPCLPTLNASQLLCELGNPMKRGAQVRFYLIVSTSGITIDTQELALALELSTISEQPGLQPVTARAHVVIELPLSVTGVADPPRLFFGGRVRGESAMHSEGQVGSAVRYEVTVSNRGQSLDTLGSAFLNLQWPHEIANGKWLLYPLRLELAARPGQRVACSPAANPLRLALEGQGPGRSRREAESSVATSTGPWWQHVRAERKKNVTLDCARGTARCLVFQCPLHSFDRSAVLTVWGRLWNSTFLEEYPAVTSLQLLVRANVTVKSTVRNLVLKDAATQIPVTIYLDPSAVVARGIPWWIILIAVLAGILVLGLLVSVLWKCGFFQRSRRAAPYATNYYRARLAVQPSEAEKQAGEA